MKTSFVLSISPTSFSPATYTADLASAVRDVARLGFEGVELHVRNPKEVDLRFVRELIEQSGLAVSAIGTGQAYVDDHLSLCDPDAGVRRRAAERLKDGIDFAAEFDAILIVGLIRGRTAEGMSKDQALELIEDGLRSCLSTAQQKGVTVVLEPINRYETDIINTVSEALDFVEKLDFPNLGLLVDTFHMNIEEPSIRGSLVSAGSRIAHVHTADSNRWAPGFGHIDFAEVVKTLKEVGYEGYLSAEILPLPDLRAAAEMAIGTLISALSPSR
ncbi:MAG: 5-keto-L-gluconate epimerase [Armatimonadota bacterium]|nr:5-keto-L-gluconate epimerase [Armatimonadota bacterium]